MLKRLWLAILALWAAIYFILNAVGVLQTARDLFRNRGEVVKAIIAILTSQWLPLALFVGAVIVLAVIHFDIFRRKPKKNNRLKEPSPSLQPQSTYWDRLVARASVQQTAQRETERKQRAIVVKIRDLIKSTEAQSLGDRYDVLGGLVKYSDDFDGEQEVRSVCEELEHEFGHPFKLLEKESNNALQGEWLQFLRDARVSRSEIKNLMNAIGWAATRWRNTERWKQGRREVTGNYPVRATEHQEVFTAIDNLKALAREGEQMLLGYYLPNLEVPAPDEVENYLERTLDAAKHRALRDEGVTAKQIAQLQESWDEGELLQKKAELQDLGTLSEWTLTNIFESVAFDRLYSRVQRMWELLQFIEGVDSRPRPPGG